MKLKQKLFVFFFFLIFIFTSQNIFSQSGWFRQNFPLYNSKTMLSIQFVNENTGYAAGVFEIMKTTNAGVSWISQEVDTSGIFYSVYFANENTGYIGGQSYGSSSRGKIWKTTNGGQTWNTILSSQAYLVITVFFVNSNTGYAAGNHAIIKTTNARGNLGYTINRRSVCF